MAVGYRGDGAVAVGAKQARSFRANSLDCVGTRVTKRIGLAYGNRRDRRVNRIEKARSAGSFSAVVRDFQKIRGEFVTICQDAPFDGSLESGHRTLTLTPAQSKCSPRRRWITGTLLAWATASTFR